MERRYKGTGYRYPTYYLVECPKCKHEAKVTLGDRYPSELELGIECPNCMYIAEYKDFILYKATVRRRCPDCGKEISYEQENLKEPVKDVTIKCSSCSFEAEYKPNIEQYILKPDLNGLKGDPIFGYLLWLQTEVKGNLFWAYNREHLEEIKIFVDADLRERQSAYRKTMTARLPEFIKTAKNRQDILKAISVLQQVE